MRQTYFTFFLEHRIIFYRVMVHGQLMWKHRMLKSTVHWYLLHILCHCADHVGLLPTSVYICPSCVGFILSLSNARYAVLSRPCLINIWYALLFVRQSSVLYHLCRYQGTPMHQTCKKLVRFCQYVAKKRRLLYFSIPWRGLWITVLGRPYLSQSINHDKSPVFIMKSPQYSSTIIR